LKILQVIPYFTPKLGGDVNICYNLSKYLAGCGHEITIITTTHMFDEEYANSLRNIGIRVIAFKCVSHFSMFFISPEMIKWTKNEIKNFDIVHMHSYRTFQNIVTFYFAKRYKKPFLIQPHTSTHRLFQRKNLKLLFDLVCGYKIMKNANAVISVSNEEVKHDLKMGVPKEKIFVVYNGINIESFHVKSKESFYKDNYGIDGKVILYLGRIHRLKGIDDLILAFSNLAKEIDNILLVVAGADDGYLTELKHLTHILELDDNVKFIGFIKETDKPAVYADAHLFIHAVKYMGGVGIAPLESILCGTPVIVTEGCGEVIKEAKCGCIVEYGDIEGLKDKMKFLLSNPEQGKVMVERGREYIETNLSWNAVGKKVELIYENCLHNL
jgi:glycosyltransferase involved in cell wall biosynthesis